MITGIGVVFLPLCLLFINNPARLLELVLIGSAFALPRFWYLVDLAWHLDWFPLPCSSDLLS